MSELLTTAPLVAVLLAAIGWIGRWIVTKYTELATETARALQGNSDALNGLKEMLGATSQSSKELRDELIKRPCLARGRDAD